MSKAATPESDATFILAPCGKVLRRAALPLSCTVSLRAESAAAQRPVAPVVTTIDSARADGSIVRVPLRTQRRGFELFAGADNAGGGLHMTGLLSAAITNEGGPISVDQTRGNVIGQLIGGSLFMFEMGFVLGSPPVNYERIRKVHPGVEAMTGSRGYSAHFWQTAARPTVRRRTCTSRACRSRASFASIR